MKLETYNHCLRVAEKASETPPTELSAEGCILVLVSQFKYVQTQMHNKLDDYSKMLRGISDSMASIQDDLKKLEEEIKTRKRPVRRKPKGS